MEAAGLVRFAMSQSQLLYITHKCYATGLSANRFVRHLKHVAHSAPAKNIRALCDILHFFRVRGWYHQDVNPPGSED